MTAALLDELLDGYTAPYNLMAAMIVAFSALGLLVALFAIQGTVTSAILADFKTIGILRAQGFRPADVRRVYEIQYLVLAGIAAPIGRPGCPLASRSAMMAAAMSRKWAISRSRSVRHSGRACGSMSRCTASKRSLGAAPAALKSRTRWTMASAAPRFSGSTYSWVLR